jgi:hypothetical protein
VTTIQRALVADVVRMDTGHTEDLELGVTEEFLPANARLFNGPARR